MLMETILVLNIQETTTDVNGTTYAGLWFQWEFVSKVKNQFNSRDGLSYSIHFIKIQFHKNQKYLVVMMPQHGIH